MKTRQINVSAEELKLLHRALNDNADRLKAKAAGLLARVPDLSKPGEVAWKAQAHKQLELADSMYARARMFKGVLRDFETPLKDENR